MLEYNDRARSLVSETIPVCKRQAKNVPCVAKSLLGSKPLQQVSDKHSRNERDRAADVGSTKADHEQATPFRETLYGPRKR